MSQHGLGGNVLRVRLIGLNITGTSQTLYGTLILCIGQDLKTSGGNIQDKNGKSIVFNIEDIENESSKFNKN